MGVLAREARHCPRRAHTASMASRESLALRFEECAAGAAGSIGENVGPGSNGLDSRPHNIRFAGGRIRVGSLCGGDDRVV